MMESFFIDENQTVKIDFSQAAWYFDKLHDMYHQAKISDTLKDVDCIFANDKEIVFVEYKNSNFKGVDKPEAFNPINIDKINGVAKKYYDSLHYFYGMNFDKNITKKYVYLLECKNGDIVLRNYVREKLVNILPFRLQKTGAFPHRLIDEVSVLSIEEWNKSYAAYPAILLK